MSKFSTFTNVDYPLTPKIPEHWRALPCRAFVAEKVEKNNDGIEREYLSLMSNVGVIRYSEKGDVGNKAPDDLTKCKVVEKGNLVINSMNYSIGSYGISPYDGVCSPVYIVLEPITSVVLRRFALRIFENKEFQNWAQSFGSGILAHRAAIGWDDLKNIIVGIPPLGEQQKIAQFLDHETAKIDALIAEQERLIELLQEKRQAVISHAVTKGLDPNVPMKDSGVEWLGEVPEHWNIIPLKHIAKLNPSKSEYTGSKSALCTFIPMEKLKTNCLELDENRTISEVYPGYTYFREGDVLFAKVTPCFENRNTAVASNLTNGIGFGSSEINVFRPYKVAARFMYYRLLEDVLVNFWTSEMTGAGGLKRVPSNVIENYLIALPNATEQEKIASYLDDRIQKMDKLSSEAKHNAELLKERRSALISAAVTGKIDVRDWQPPIGSDTVDSDESVQMERQHG